MFKRAGTGPEKEPGARKMGPEDMVREIFSQDRFKRDWGAKIKFPASRARSMISALFAEEKAEKLKKGPNPGEPNPVEKPVRRSRKRPRVEVVASSKPGEHPEKRGRFELTEPVGFEAGRGRVPPHADGSLNLDEISDNEDGGNEDEDL
jgi:hypothetical protein